MRFEMVSCGTVAHRITIDGTSRRRGWNPECSLGTEPRGREESAAPAAGRAAVESGGWKLCQGNCRLQDGYGYGIEE